MLLGGNIMKKIKSIINKFSMILAITILLGAILMPTVQVKAAANWWWAEKYVGGAPGAYYASVGATSNGAPVKAWLYGISTSTRLWTRYWGPYYVTSPDVSYTQLKNVFNPSGGFGY